MDRATSPENLIAEGAEQETLQSLARLIEQVPGEVGEQLRKGLAELDSAIDAMYRRNKNLAEAQAKAIVNSAMVMSELKETHQQLEKARTDAESASAAKSEFLANMSHEIRTPINGVLGMNEILLRSNLSPTQRRCASIIKNSVEALLQIINDILDFSKIEAGKFQLVAAPFDLRDVVEDVVQLFAENAQRKGVELNVVAGAGCRTHFIGDAGRLRQILANLIGNAIKFTESGEVIVRFDVERDDSDTCNVRFEVEDTGIGIEPEVQKRIFESFTQADSSTERRFGGTGLGLTISSQLVHLMDGELGVRSTPGEGANFHFNVNLKSDLAERNALEEQADLLSGARVLAVDDTETNRIIYGDQLSHWQCDFELACDGREALQLLNAAHDKGRPFEIIILDMHMPHMDGLALAREINRDPRNKNLTRVMLSSIGDQLSETLDPSVNIQIYMTKPVRYRELRDCLCDIKAGRTHQGFNLDLPQLKKLSGHVLLAEDNFVNQEVARDLLELNNLTVDVTNNGEEALAAFENRAYDLVLMDCQMPKLDGFGATQAIRELEKRDGRSGTPIIALTAFALPGDREKCIDAGMDDYLEKPFTDEQLRDVLGRWLDRAADTDKKAKPAAEDQKAQKPAQFDEAVFLPESMAHFEQRERDGKAGILKRIVGGYLAQSTEYIESLDKAANEDDVEKISFASHALKSSSKVVGGEALFALCKALEASSKNGCVDNARQSVDEIIRCHELTADALKQRYQDYLA